jgi:hypothetical protein
LRRSLGLWLALAAPSLARSAAYDVEVRAEAQAYAVAARAPDAGRLLLRRRLVEVLDLAGFEVVPGEDAGLSLLLRLDVDFAVNDAEVAGLDGAARNRLQLLAGRFHWNGLAAGRLDLEAGRIAALDPVGFWRLDGGRLTLRPWRWLALSVFGGLRVTAASWLASPTFAPDGTREADRRRIAEGTPLLPCPGVPQRLCADATLDDAAPAWGARLAVSGGLASAAEVEVRRVLRAGAVLEEKVAGGARLRRGGGAVEAAAEWDLYVGRLSSARASLRLPPLAGLTLAAEGIHAHPTFSADSIWNLFDTAPTREGRLRADVAPAGWPFRAFAAGGLRRYQPTAFGRAVLGDPGGWEPFGSAGVGGELGRTSLAADGTVRGGPQGAQAWVEGRARRTFRGWVDLEARFSLARVEDRVAPKNGGTYPALALAVSGRLERRARLAVLLEDSAPRWERNDLRVFALLSLGADWDTRLR